MGALLTHVPRLFGRRSGRRWLVVLVVVALALGLGYVALNRLMSSALEDVESSFDARMTYRDSWIVCEDQMSVACARTAADRAAHPIIWVKTPEEFGLQLDAMAAAKGEARSFAAQELKGGDFVVSVVSGFKGGMTGIRAGTVSANGRKAEIWEDEDAVELRWSSGGIQYHVGVVALGLRPGSEWDERSLAEAVFRRLLVSSPAT